MLWVLVGVILGWDIGDIPVEGFLPEGTCKAKKATNKITPIIKKGLVGLGGPLS